MLRANRAFSRPARHGTAALASLSLLLAACSPQSGTPAGGSTAAPRCHVARVHSGTSTSAHRRRQAAGGSARQPRATPRPHATGAPAPALRPRRAAHPRHRARARRCPSLRWPISARRCIPSPTPRPTPSPGSTRPILLWGGGDGSGGLLAFDWDKLEYGRPWPPPCPRVSPDGKTYTFTLRNDLKWSDGSPITVDDFQFAWDNASKKENDFVNLDQLEEIASYTHARQNTIEITLNEPKARDVALGTVNTIGPIPKKVWENKPWNDTSANPEILNPERGARPVQGPGVQDRRARRVRPGVDVSRRATENPAGRDSAGPAADRRLRSAQERPRQLRAEHPTRAVRGGQSPIRT